MSCNRALHAKLGRAEFAMIMESFGKKGSCEFTQETAKVVVGEERLPEGWKPTHTLHLPSVVARSNRIRLEMEKIKKAAMDARSGLNEEHKEAHSRLDTVLNWSMGYLG